MLLYILPILILFLLPSSLLSSTPSIAFKSPSSPLYSLLQQYYTGHPYQWAGLSYANIDYNQFAQTIKYGNPQDYQIIDLVGSGYFGTVSKAIHKDFPEKVFAYKSLKLPCDNSRLLKELYILYQLKDAPNYLPIRDILKTEDANGKPACVLVFDFFKSVDYHEFRQHLTKSQLKRFLYDVFTTLDYIHSRGVIHRDLKADNILVNPHTKQVRLIDLNQAVHYLPGKRLMTFVMENPHKPPELLLDSRYYDYSVDIWSLGIILAELVFKKHPFPGYPASPFVLDESLREIAAKSRYFEIYRRLLDNIERVMGSVELAQYVDKFREEWELDPKTLKGFKNYYPKVNLKDLIDPGHKEIADALVMDLMRKMLVVDHTKRITAKEALLHPYFTDMSD